MSEALIRQIRDSVIGASDVVDGPFGSRRVTYADYTASGRSLSFIEDFIRDHVLPLYANTHTESSGTGLQTTNFREDARAIIRRCVGATDDHAIVFCGSGSTGAIDRMVQVLNLRLPADLDRRYGLSAHIPADERPVIFIGPFEHHSNELAWRESISDVVVIDEDADGHVDLAQLEEELNRYADRPLKIGSFSAASNVTGIMTDTAAVASLLHRHGALSFWDFAAAAPYIGISMTAESPDDPLTYLDAIFLSPHKMIGGPGTPGILVARKELFRNSVPAIPGGGTVVFVNPDNHEYLTDIEHREEGGTPAIVESIRAGLVFQLKEAVGLDAIRSREESFIKRAIESWSANPNIHVLGNHEAERLSIVSFTVSHAGKQLHHNYVVALLNDLFGVQSRGGCSCAGPYGHRLLHIGIEESEEFQREVAKGCEGIKPGWVRVNFNYFITDEVFDFIIEAVHLVANDGWRLLPSYTFEPLSGLWRHNSAGEGAALSLHDVRYESGEMQFAGERQREGVDQLATYLDQAKEILTLAGPTPTPPDHIELSADFEHLRWFHLPEELQRELLSGSN